MEKDLCESRCVYAHVRKKKNKKKRKNNASPYFRSLFSVWSCDKVRGKKKIDCLYAHHIARGHNGLDDYEAITRVRS